MEIGKGLADRQQHGKAGGDAAGGTKGQAAGQQHGGGADGYSQQRQQGGQGNGYAHQRYHPIAAAETGKDGFPMAGYGGSPGQDQGMVIFRANQQAGYGNRQRAFGGIGGEHQDPVAAADVPEHIGGAGPGAAGGKNVNAPPPGNQMGKGYGTQQITDNHRRQQADHYIL